MKTTTKKPISIIAGLAMILVFASCNSKVMKGSASAGGGGGQVFKGNPTIAFADVHDRVLGPYCQKCHDEFASYKEMMTPNHVVPGEPSLSGIFTRLKNNGGDMPAKENPMIPDADAALIRDWIAQGAPEFIAQNPPVVPAPAPAPAPKPVPAPPAPPVTFGEVESKVLGPKCTKCHGSGSRLGDFTTYATTMNDVKPNDFAGSKLIKNLQGFGGDMPKKSAPLSQAEVDLLKAWINGGALEVAPKVPATPTFTDMQAKIFGPKCVLCHSDAKLAAGFSLETYDPIVVNLRLFDAKSPDKSGLYQSVIDDYMPLKEAVAAGEVRALTPDEKLLLKTWLEAGAPR